MVSRKQVSAKNIELQDSWSSSKFSIFYTKYLVSQKKIGALSKFLYGILHYLNSIIVIIQNIGNLIGWNSVHIFDIFNHYCADINGMWNAEKLGGIYKTFEFTLT